jgi:pantoate--beta-alanine ligase
MKVLYTIADFNKARNELKGTLGLVPTMGYLHQGHLALVRQARLENKFVAVSIFVNPTQFGPSEDFAQYPHDPERDISLLEKEKVDLVFMPDISEMYPPDFSTWVDVEGVTDRLEGVSRPGHFRGVATVVAKLFNIVQPDNAYFGQKDAQQVLVIKKMVAELNMKVNIIAVPTVREPDGLAMSSRNSYLSPAERKASLVLWQSLDLAQQLFSAGERQADYIRQKMTQLIEKEPLAKINYISIANADSLAELFEINCPALISLAVWIGKTRLIDTILINQD